MNRVHPDPTPPGGLAQMAMAVRLAAWHVVAEVESCPCVTLDDTRHYDTRPLLDPRERAPETIDMAEQAIQWGVREHYLARHPQQPHMVRVTVKGCMA